MKTARFAELVKRGGAPATYLLWTPARKDRIFQRALAAQRILSVHQEHVGAKKDHGIVGFSQEPNTQFLIFPRSLGAFADRRIIGINYDLLAPESRPGTASAASPRSPRTTSPRTTTRTRPAGSREVEAAKVVPFVPPTPQAPATAASKRTPTPRTRERGGRKPPSVSKKPHSTPVVPAALAVRATADEPAAPRRTAKATPARDGMARRWRVEVSQAMRELRAGKSVAAYERLAALVGAMSAR